MSGSDNFRRDLVDQLDAELGARFRQRREMAGVTQQWVANAMRSRYGINWHQTTVGKTEDGGRPLKLSEALALAMIFGYGPRLDELVHGGSVAPSLPTDRLEGAYEELAGLYVQLGERMGDLQRGMRAAREVPADSEAGSDGRPTG